MGEYLPLTVEGANADHVVAFIRQIEGANARVLVVVPRLVATLLGDSNLPPVGANFWGNTHILLPTRSKDGKLQNIFTGEAAELPKNANQAKINVGEALARFPAGLFLLE
jgi:(1->4)-alpha-D-glucan 1-alpha-D-glucosylmutase